MTSPKDHNNAKPKTEFIVINETVWRSWMRDASTFALFAGLIGIGIIAESAAMQWAGLLIAAITVVSRAGAMKIKRMTRVEAISYLQNREDA